MFQGSVGIFLENNNSSPLPPMWHTVPRVDLVSSGEGQRAPAVKGGFLKFGGRLQSWCKQIPPPEINNKYGYHGVFEIMGYMSL